MPKNRPTAAQRARRVQAADGGAYTDVLHSLSTPAKPAGGSPRADAWLTAILEHLQNLGWPASTAPERYQGRWRVRCGPVELAAGREVDDTEAFEPGADPDDPRWSTAPLYLSATAPPEPDGQHLDTGAYDDQGPEAIAAHVNAELARARRRAVQDCEAESTAPCPICGDRYAERHLLANSFDGEPTCPACVFDGDQRFYTDLPHLAEQIDTLLETDLAAPAGWACVAAVLALTCGANLGRRIEREAGGWPQLTERWDRPMNSWIWLSPRETRHPALANLGAVASLSSITDALERHEPTLPQQAQRICREAEVRWRPALWPAACAYAAAFTTQAAERDRHRKPVHVVASTSDGLSLILEPFAVTGDAINVETGLEQILEHLLFPMLLGHGLHDEPRDEPRRVYGAEESDERPAQARSDARISHETDRAAQIAVVLGKIPGMRSSEVIWEGRADPDHDAAPLGASSPVTAVIDELRQAARIEIAGLMYDATGGIAMIADEAWSRAGWWIPADDAAHALRQAREFLTGRPYIDVLWAGPAGHLPEPGWQRVRVSEVNAHSTGPQDVPWLRVFDGEAVFGMRLCDIGVIRRADPEHQSRPQETDEPRAQAASAPAGGPLLADDLPLLIDQYLHLASHRLGPGWQAVDQAAYSTSKKLLATLEEEHRGHFMTSFKASINLFDTWHECPGGNAKPTPAIALTGRPFEVEFSFVKHDPACCDAPYGCEIADELPALVTVLALFGGTIEATPSMPEDKQDDYRRMTEIFWEVKDQELDEVCRRVWRAESTAPHGGIMELDTNPPYLPPWDIAEGWTVPDGGTAMIDAVAPPGWKPRAVAGG